jgi:hypothetical protein
MSLEPLGNAIAYILQEDPEWSADTLDAIARVLVANGHAEYDENCLFRATTELK